MIANKLKRGDEIRIVAPSRNLSEVWQDVYHHAVDFWTKEGFTITFSKNAREVGKFHSSSIASRVEDLHDAFCDPNVKMIVPCLGGFNANQLLRHLDYSLIAKHPKIFCGYSDITALLNAIYAKTGLVTYHGPHFTTFGFNEETAYSAEALWNAVMKNDPFQVIPSDSAGNYAVIQEGCCEGKIIGGNLCTLNLLQGTPYMPDLRDSILFLEDDNIMGDFFPYEFDRNLESLLQTKNADTIRGIVFGRFDDSCGLTVDTIKEIIENKIPADLPVLFGVDFGHVLPIMTFPIGGIAKIVAKDHSSEITIVTH